MPRRALTGMTHVYRNFISSTGVAIEACCRKFQAGVTLPSLTTKKVTVLFACLNESVEKWPTIRSSHRRPASRLGVGHPPPWESGPQGTKQGEGDGKTT